MSENDRKPSQEKPQYEAPVLIELGALARGTGANCNLGCGPTGPCVAGGTATSTCNPGGIIL